MDELQVYDDLIQLDISKYKERIDELELHINKLNADIQTLCTRMLDMKKSQVSLTTNISALYSTARNEIQRKDRMIAQLRKEKDDILFRKGCSKRSHSRSRSQSRENKIVRLSIEKDDSAQGMIKEKAGNLKQYLAKISEDKAAKNKFNRQTTPRSSTEKDQYRTKHKEKQHFERTDNKKRFLISDHNAARSNTDGEISKTRHGLVKTLNIKENAKSRHRRRDNSSASNDKNRVRDAKQSTDLRNKLTPRSKHGADTSRRHKTDSLTDKKAPKVIKERYNKKMVSPIKKRLIKPENQMDIHDESRLDLNMVVKVSDKKLSKFAEELKVHLSKLAGSSNVNKVKSLGNESIDAHSDITTNVIPSQQFVNNDAETKIDENQIVELHIPKKSDNTVNCIPPATDDDLLLMQFEENATLETAKHLKNDIPIHNDGIQVYQNNENVNTSNNIDIVETEEKMNLTTEAPANISSNSGRRRRRRAIVFIS